MNVLQLINQMQPLDCVRSGALIFGMVAILIASNRAKSNNRKWDSVGIWLFGDSIGLGLFALGLYLFPTQVLQYEIKGDLGMLHHAGARMVGAGMLGIALMSYQYRASANRIMWLFTRFLTNLSLVILMCNAHYKPPVKDGIKFTDQHLTFGILAVVLSMMGSMFVLACQKEGFMKTAGLRIINKTDRHILIDMIILSVVVFNSLAFPETFFSHVNKQMDKNFKPDILHLHLWNVVGAYSLGVLLMCVHNFQSGDREDKKAYVYGRITMFVLFCPMTLWYNWWYTPLPLKELVSSWLFIIAALINLALA